MEYFFVSTTQVPDKYRVLRTKEELLNYLAFKIDQSIENGATHFDLVIDTNGEE